MAEGGGRPASCSVTGLAIVVACNVGRIFARSSRAVVTGRACRRDARMTECRRRPTSCLMAILAGIIRRQMGGIFARRLRPVMAS